MKEGKDSIGSLLRRISYVNMKEGKVSIVNSLRRN